MNALLRRRDFPERRGGDALFGRDAPGAQNQGARGRSTTASATLAACRRRPDRRLRRRGALGRRRPSALSASLVVSAKTSSKLAIREQGVALGDDRGAVKHVAVAIRRPAVSNVVGSREQRHAARAEPGRRAARARRGARGHDRDFRAGERVGRLREQIWPDGSERERVADRDSPLHARGDRPMSDVAQARRRRSCRCHADECRFPCRTSGRGRRRCRAGP